MAFDVAAAAALRQRSLHRVRAQEAARSMHPNLTSASHGAPLTTTGKQQRRERFHRKFGEILIRAPAAAGSSGAASCGGKRVAMASAPWTGRASQATSQADKGPAFAPPQDGSTARSAFCHNDPMPAAFEWSSTRSLVAASSVHESCLRAELEAERAPAPAAAAAAALAQAAQADRELFDYKRSSNRSKAGRTMFGSAPRRYGGQYTSLAAEAMDAPFGQRVDAQLGAVAGGAEHEEQVRAQRTQEIAEMRREALARGQKGQLMLRRRGPSGKLQSFIRDACS